MRRLFAPAVALVLLLLPLALVACDGGSGGEGAATDVPAARTVESKFKGVLALPPFPKPDIVLADTGGMPFDLRADTEGSVLLLYLGYTYCPDICPTHMADISSVLEELPPDVAARIAVVFVTTDPARDTPERLREWLDVFSTDFIGLVPEENQLGQLLKNLSMAPIEKTDLGGGAYSVNHAAYVLAYSNDNLAHLVYPLGVTRETWANDLELLVKEGWTE